MLKEGGVRRPRSLASAPRCAVKDAQLKALIRKTTGKAEQKKPQQRPSFDPTIEATRTDDARTQDAKDLFKEMKRREF